MTAQGGDMGGRGGDATRRLLLSALLLAAGVSARADRLANIQVTAAWAPPSLAGAHNGVAYFTLHDRAGPPDRLVSVSTPVAERAELHMMELKNGVMSMRPAGALPLAAGRAVTLAPDGLHLMLIGLKQPLRPGDRFPLTLSFEHEPPLGVEVEVRPAASAH
jgi:copper(I)-binding protein